MFPPLITDKAAKQSQSKIIYRGHLRLSKYYKEYNSRLLGDFKMNTVDYLIKISFRNSLDQDMLNSLAICSIQKGAISEILNGFVKRAPNTFSVNMFFSAFI